MVADKTFTDADYRTVLRKVCPFFSLPEILIQKHANMTGTLQSVEIC